MKKNPELPASTQSRLDNLYELSKLEGLKVAKSFVSKLKPADVGTAFLPISHEQGEYLYQLICEKNFKTIVEFGTSFSI